MSEAGGSEAVSVAERVTRLREDARAVRQTAGGYAGIAMGGVGLEVMTNVFLSNNRLATVASFALAVGGVYFGVPKALEGVQMGQEIAALEAVQAHHDGEAAEGSRR
jgi:hypothetical protein